MRDDHAIEIPSEHVIDLAGQGFTRFKAETGVDRKSVGSEINPRLRYFLFAEKPDRRQLVKVTGEPPLETEC